MAETTPSGGFDDRAIQRLAGLDKQIATLFTCKPLPESEISKLCDQVRTSLLFKIDWSSVPNRQSLFLIEFCPSKLMATFSFAVKSIDNTLSFYRGYIN